LLFGLALVAAPHLSHVPLWVLVSAAGTGCWAAALGRFRKPVPGPFSRTVLVLIALSAVYASFHTLTGRNAGVALLLLMVGLKLLETRTLRDLYVSVFLGYFLIATNFLYTQDILLALYMVAPVLLLTATLVSASDLGHTLGTVGTLRLSARILVYALPLAAIQFVLFPRVSGPLWGLPGDAYGSVTGLSDELTPGLISDLAESDAVAFRVQFAREPPAPDMRYWRGPVFWRTDGRRWTRLPLAGPPPEVHSSQPETHYTEMVEPNNRRWLFPLDLPVAAPTGTELTADFQLLTHERLRERSVYHLTSAIPDRTGSLTPERRHLALQIPTGINPRAQALAARWRDSDASPEAIVQTALDYFRQHPFVYTLQPPTLGTDAVDQFLFDTRRGYCEHFATAFTFLMRAAGIPARVVTGYQGGDYNPIGGYLIVRQRDAHAWSEVWLPSTGWTRVDPTATVAPERIDLGTEQFRQVVAGQGRIGFVTTAFWQRATAGIGLAWDAVDNGWNRWILAYGPRLQQDLFNSLGWTPASWKGPAAVLALATALSMAILALFAAPAHETPDNLVKLYQRFCTRLAKKGLARTLQEGPFDYARRVSLTLPHLAHSVLLITRIYVALRYGSSRSEAAYRRLDRLVRRFRP
jgi:protein-glutamine gamma-glutamyltransferase